MTSNIVEQVLGFWFADGDDQSREVWFKTDPSFDREIEQRFKMHHDKARLGEYDGLTDTVARAALAAGHDRSLTVVQRTFMYLPFEHSEDINEQEKSVQLFEDLGDEDKLKYAIEHRDIIERFGRFPHRNAVLGRPSTAEEIEFLKGFDSF